MIWLNNFMFYKETGIRVSRTDRCTRLKHCIFTLLCHI